ncbi:MAG TPA: hypothetical protein VN680_19060 [Burkholderiaceae bacterium]|jgi:hypothetical protein|nr:hypothetical protein [Burkholderiaceae bacterium]
MCLIIQKPAGRRIPDEFLRNAWTTNPDGWGSFQRVDGQLVRRRGLQLEDLLHYNRSLGPREEVNIHLRRATYGPVNMAMTHPFVVTPDLLMMHNGTLHPLAPESRAVSDTCELARLLDDMLHGLSPDQAAALIRSEGFVRLTAPLIDGSMVLLLDRDGLVRLGRDWHTVGEGEWDASMHGIRVSNTYSWTRQGEPAQVELALAA